MWAKGLRGACAVRRRRPLTKWRAPEAGRGRGGSAGFKIKMCGVGMRQPVPLNVSSGRDCSLTAGPASRDVRGAALSLLRTSSGV